MRTTDRRCLPAPEQLTLVRDEVHVWCASLGATELDMHALRSILAQDEVERAERYRSAEDRDRFVFARGLLRFILGRYLAMPPEKVQIQCGPLGKVAERTSLRFSVSHSSVLVLYALAHARHVGIELEHVRLLSEVRTLVERFFSATEQAAFRALPREDQLLVAL